MLSSVLGIVMFLAVVACRYEPMGMPRHFPTTRLSGKVMLAGRPIPKGWVSLFPVESTLGDPLLIAVEPDGTYSTDKAPIGPLAVRVSIPKSDLDIIRKSEPAIADKLERLGGLKSPIRIKTKPETQNSFDVDLIFVPVPSP